MLKSNRIEIRSNSVKTRNVKIFNGISIGITGTLRVKQKEMIEIIEKNGGIYDKTITQKCKYLITNNLTLNIGLTTIKHKKAIKQNVKIMREQWIYDCLKQNRLILYHETDGINRSYLIKPIQSNKSQITHYLSTKPSSNFNQGIFIKIRKNPLSISLLS